MGWTTDQTAAGLSKAQQLAWEAVEQCASQPGLHLVCNPPGTGKSYAARRIAKQLLKDGKRVGFYLPTLDTRKETAEALANLGMVPHTLEGVGPDTRDDYELVWAANRAAPGGGRHVREDKRGAAKLDANRRGAAHAELLLATHPWLLAEAYRSADVLFIDESLLWTCFTWVELSSSDLRGLERAGDIRVHEAVYAALEASWTAKAEGGYPLTAVEEVMEVHLEQLLQLPADKPEYKAGNHAIEEAQIVGWGTTGLERLREAPPGAAIKALQAGYWKAPRAAYMRHGRLLLPMVQLPAPPRSGQSIVVLDATGTPDVMRALWPGVTASCHRVKMERPVGLEVLHIPDTNASGSTSGGSFTRRRRKDAAWCVHVGLADADGLQALPKRWLDAPKDNPRSEVAELIESCPGELIYHGGPVSRGSNEHKDKAHAVVGAYRVPSLAIDSLGSIMAHVAGSPEDDPSRWRRAARFQLETAPELQIAHRLRPTHGSPDNPKLIVWADEHAPEEEVLRPTATIDVLDLAWMFGGRLRRETVGRAVRAVLESRGGVWVPRLDDLSSTSASRALLECATASIFVIEYLRAKIEAVAHWSNEHIIQPHEGTFYDQICKVCRSASDVATLAGVHVGYIPSPTGGRLAVLSLEPLSPSQLAEVAPRLCPPVRPWKERVHEAWITLRAEDGSPPTAQLIAAMEVSRRTFYRRCDGQLEVWRDEWKRAWLAEEPPADLPTVHPPEVAELEEPPDASPDVVVSRSSEQLAQAWFTPEILGLEVYERVRLRAHWTGRPVDIWTLSAATCVPTWMWEERITQRLAEAALALSEDIPPLLGADRECWVSRKPYNLDRQERGLKRAQISRPSVSPY